MPGQSRSRRAVVAGVAALALVTPAIAVPEAAELVPAAVAQPADAFSQRYTTDNFWNQSKAAVQGLQLDPGTKVEATTKTIFNWGFRNDGGTLVLIRPQSATAFKSDDQDIKVKVTPATGAAYTTTLKVNIVDARPAQEWEQQLGNTFVVDFEKNTVAKPVDQLQLPAGVTVSKNATAAPAGWKVTMNGGNVSVEPPATFIQSAVNLPVKVNDGKDTFDATLKLDARNPQTPPKEVADTAASIIGKVIGGFLGTGGAGDLLGSILGGLGNGGGNGLVIITIGSNNNVVITDNANPTVDVKDNGNNNGINNGDRTGGGSAARCIAPPRRARPAAGRADPDRLGAADPHSAARAALGAGGRHVQRRGPPVRPRPRPGDRRRRRRARRGAGAVGAALCHSGAPAAPVIKTQTA